MATTYRALIALVLLSCSEEFTNASNHIVNDSASGDTLQHKDNRPNPLPSHDSGVVPVREASPPPVSTGQTDSGNTPVHDAYVVPSDQVSPNPVVDSSSSQADGPTEQDAKPTYCIDCPPVFGRPPCCSIYLKCGYITSLGQCTSGTF